MFLCVRGASCQFRFGTHVILHKSADLNQGEGEDEMSYAPSNFRRTDVKRAIQAAQAAGIKIRRVELEGGKVSIIPADDEAVADDSNNSFDKIMRK